MSVISHFFKDVKLFLKRSCKIDRTKEGSSSHLRTDQANMDEVGFAQELLFRKILRCHVFLMVKKNSEIDAVFLLLTQIENPKFMDLLLWGKHTTLEP